MGYSFGHLKDRPSTLKYNMQYTAYKIDAFIGIEQLCKGKMVYFTARTWISIDRTSYICMESIIGIR